MPFAVVARPMHLLSTLIVTEKKMISDVGLLQIKKQRKDEGKEE
jgi:type IV secretory pathway VirB3-like protein